MATKPPPPGRLSTVTPCFQRAASFPPTMRSTASGPLPTAKAVITVTGRVGKLAALLEPACAQAQCSGAMEASSRAAPARALRREGAAPRRLDGDAFTVCLLLDLLFLLLAMPPSFLRGRSEEHTSELQSPRNIVCRLLLGKKKRH